MSATIVPFPRQSPQASLADLQAQTRRETARLEAEIRVALEEAERVRQDYLERQKRIDRLLADIHRNSERA